jgi:PKD repeat protein
MRRRVVLTGLALLLAALAQAPYARAAGQNAGVMLSGHAASWATAASPPVIQAPAIVTAASDQPVNIQADATDPDAGDILTITESGAPASLAFSHTPSVSPATATLSGTVTDAEIGSYNILWQVSDGNGGTASTNTMLTVDPNHDPIVTAPSTVSGAETVEMSFPIAVSDPDGDPVTSIAAAPLPSGATFTPNVLHTGGEFNWTPAIGQMGSYSVTFTARSGTPSRTGTATTQIEIAAQDRPPVITSPSTVNTFVNTFTTFNVTVSDPDGDAINLLEAKGTQNTALPPGATFTPSANYTMGTFTWIPMTPQTVSIDIIAYSGALNLRTVKVTKIIVKDRAPVITAPASVTVNEGDPLTLNVSASDPDGTPIFSLTAAPLPLGATFAPNLSNTAGVLNWTPDFAQAGVYPVTFTATNALSGTAVTQITVVNQNRAPVADPDGPYTGVAGVPVAFHGTGSSDPDGDALTYAWDFGDLSTGSGASPSHIYSTGGNYTVSLTVTDTGTPPLSNTATTSASIQTALDAGVFTSGGNKIIRLGSGKPTWCAQVEPVNESFALTDALLSTIVLKYGAGQIPALSGKTSIASDSDKNGVDEIGVCFSKDDLRTLFAGLPGGRNTVSVTIEGQLMSGAHFSGSLTVDVQSSGSTLAASLSPNPFNPEAVLTIKTAKAGYLRVRLYDSAGRLMRVLADEPGASAGYHDIRIDGRDGSGQRLSSGIYFYRVETAEGEMVGRASIVK